MSLSTPQTVRNLRAALHAKAKGSPSFRFYSLYDRLSRPDILSHAYATRKANGGSSGVDGQTFEDIEAYGQERWLGCGELAYRAADAHARSRLRQWLCAKHKVASGVFTILRPVPDRTVRPGATAVASAPLPACERMTPCPRAGCGKSARPVR